MIFAKRWDELSESDVIQIHVDCPNVAETTDFLVISTIWRMEGEARHAITYENSRIFLPVMACLSILDQIGTSYGVTSKPAYPDANASGIKKAAYYLLGFGANDLITKTLYAFRNGVMHEASFSSRDSAGNSYWFRFDSEITESVKPAQSLWDGTLTTQSEANCSYINPRRLLDSTRGALDELKTHLHNGTLTVVHPEGVDGIKAKCLMRLPRRA